MLGHKTYLNKFLMTEDTQNVLFNHSKIKLETNNDKNFSKEDKQIANKHLANTQHHY